MPKKRAQTACIDKKVAPNPRLGQHKTLDARFRAVNATATVSRSNSNARVKYQSEAAFRDSQIKISRKGQSGNTRNMQGYLASDPNNFQRSNLNVQSGMINSQHEDQNLNATKTFDFAEPLSCDDIDEQDCK